MSRVYQRQDRPTWYVAFTDHAGVQRKVSGFRDRRATEALRVRIDHLVALRAVGEPLDASLVRWITGLQPRIRNRLAAIGVLEPGRAAAAAPLSDHLEAFERSILSGENTKQHAAQTRKRAEAVFAGCVYWSDITPSGVEGQLRALRQGDRPISARTCNYYLSAARQFCTWMADRGLAPESPIRGLKPLSASKIRQDGARENRALTLDEQRGLVQAAHDGPVRERVSGPERALIYRVALETGLRSGELERLTRADFDLDSSPASVTCRAESAKNREASVLVIRERLAEDLAPHLASKHPRALAFTMPHRSHRARMVRADLVAAGFTGEDEEGRVANFHSLRHTFVTNAANSGAHPNTIKNLARHSTITLTMDRYTHRVVESERAAIEALPDLRPDDGGAAMRETGTESHSGGASGGAVQRSAYVLACPRMSPGGVVLEAASGFEPEITDLQSVDTPPVRGDGGDTSGVSDEGRGAPRDLVLGALERLEHRGEGGA